MLEIDSTYRENARSNRRTTLTARELDRFDVDIAALSETRLSGEGSLTEIGADASSTGEATLKDNHGNTGLDLKFAQRI